MAKLRVKRHTPIQPQDPSYRLIGLTQNQNAIVDATDFEWLSKFLWYANWNPHTQSFTAKRRPGKQEVFMHRVIMACTDKKQLVDHWNHDTLDNRRQNLRVCNNAQNQQNRRGRRKSTSRFKGVTWDTGRKKWFVGIRIRGKTKGLGRFENEREAAKVYDVAAIEHFGEFAFLNFPKSATSSSHPTQLKLFL